MDGYWGWLSVPMQLHSSREFECGVMTPAQCAWYQHRWHFWYEADHVFGLSTIYFCIVLVALFLLGRILYRLTPKRIAEMNFYRSTFLGLRYLSYKSFRVGLLGWQSPPIGVILLGAVGFAFFFGMILGPKPYYWPTFAFGQPANYGSSPPIATRSGWMALALFPFVIALPMKLNLITLVTGISHERLQVFHRWSAYFMLILALVHTFPFIIHDIQMGMMQIEWATDPFNKSGVAALITQAYLTFFSFAPIRNRFYEFFKFTHILAAALFAVFFFVHCNHTLTSWDYFIATAVVYFLPYLASLIRTYIWFRLAEAELALPTAHILSINIAVEKGGLRKIQWNIGQHMFLRFLSPQLGLHCITSHPFTICSYQTDGINSGCLKFYIKPLGGVTAKLASIAANNPGAKVRVFLDGPYGGMQETRQAEFDHNYIIAGGSGAGFTLPLIEDCIRQQQKKPAYLDANASFSSNSGSTSPADKASDVDIAPCNVIYSSRDPDMVSWYAAKVSELLEHYPDAKIKISLHNTALNHTGDEEAQKDEKSITLHSTLDLSQPVHIQRHAGRPNLPAILADAARTPSLVGKTVGIAVCGPAGMNHDVRNECAEMQRRLLLGEKNITLDTVHLHVETFGW